MTRHDSGRCILTRRYVTCERSTQEKFAFLFELLFSEERDEANWSTYITWAVRYHHNSVIFLVKYLLINQMPNWQWPFADICDIGPTSAYWSKVDFSVQWYDRSLFVAHQYDRRGRMCADCWALNAEYDRRIPSTPFNVRREKLSNRTSSTLVGTCVTSGLKSTP